MGSDDNTLTFDRNATGHVLSYGCVLKIRGYRVSSGKVRRSTRLRDCLSQFEELRGWGGGRVSIRLDNGVIHGYESTASVA